ncbi:MAG: glycosyltransferase family 4 protein [Acidobacteria bacterium]|nr:glycosyltransferase family 4 protein [Acidobacteriota bacterium]
MRVLHLDLGREMRGGQWQTLRLVRGLREQGHEAVLLARFDGSFRLSRLPAQRRGCDIVHTHDARGHTLAALLPGGPPLVVARRVAFPVRQGPASRWKYARAAHFVAVSEFVRARLREAGVNDERISVVCDGVEVPDEIAPPGDPPRILALANADPGKGGALVREAARRAGVTVHFTRDLERDIRGAAMLLYLTDEEGLGSAALVALASAVPVVASRVGGLPEAVEDGVTGILVENAADSVAAAIRRLVEAPGEARGMGLAGRERVAARFTTAIMVEKTLAVYRKVLS